MYYVIKVSSIFILLEYNICIEYVSNIYKLIIVNIYERKKNREKEDKKGMKMKDIF